MAVNELRPLRGGEVLDLAIRICRPRYISLMKIVAVVVIPLQLFAALIQISVAPAGTSSRGWSSITASLVSSILGGLGAQLAAAACLKPIAAAYLDAEVSWQDALEFVWSRFRDVFAVIVAVYVFSVLALVVFVLPGVYLWISWLVALPVLLLEGNRGMAALRRSAELVRGRWWATFGTYLLATVLIGIITAIMSGILLAVTGESHAGDVGRVLISAAVGSVTGIVTMPFLAAVIVILYFDMRVRKEGFGLASLASLIGGTVPPSSEPPWPSGGF
jgi:hypothetical protein